MLLATKTAIVYGASGAIGSAVARAYAREGADVHLAGRTTATLEEVAQRIRHDGGGAHVAQVDVLDRAAVAAHADAVAARGGIDICFKAISNDDVQGTPLLGLQFEDFLRPVAKAVTAHFNVATAVGRHMTRRGHGVILAMAGGREAIPRLGGSHVAWAALAGLCRSRQAHPDSTQTTGGRTRRVPAKPRRRARRVPAGCWPAPCPATTGSATSPPSPRPTGRAPSPRARSTSPVARSWTEPRHVGETVRNTRSGEKPHNGGPSAARWRTRPASRASGTGSR
jgi:3-oxoacyl-[acyl-carrier protein] reductase